MLGPVHGAGASVTKGRWEEAEQDQRPGVTPYGRARKHMVALEIGPVLKCRGPRAAKGRVVPPHKVCGGSRS